MTAKAEGLWDPIAALPGLTPVTHEDIRHIQSRVEQFHATEPVPEGTLMTVPDCAETWCRWVVADAASAALRFVHRPLTFKRLKGRSPPALPDETPEEGNAQPSFMNLRFCCSVSVRTMGV